MDGAIGQQRNSGEGAVIMYDWGFSNFMRTSTTMWWGNDRERSLGLLKNRHIKIIYVGIN